MTIDQHAEPKSPATHLEEAEHPFVFMGGIGYDEERNQRVGQVAMALTGHSNILTIPDEPKVGRKEDGPIAVFRDSDGVEEELKVEAAMKRLADPAEVRFTRLHERRAEMLIEEIAAAGGQSVDAVFQSGDTSTAILAMHKQPGLFRNVALLDPSSIIKLPPRYQYLREEWSSGNLQACLRKGKARQGLEEFEDRATRREKWVRVKRTTRGGNMDATYLSYQAQMLHEVAQSDESPNISIVASRYDHAYPPERIVQSLVRLDDIDHFYITDSRHRLGGKQNKLKETIEALGRKSDNTGSFLERVHFADSITEDYRKKITEIIRLREEVDAA
jgi:hypothetical protein